MISFERKCNQFLKSVFSCITEIRHGTLKILKPFPNQWGFKQINQTDINFVTVFNPSNI